MIQTNPNQIFVEGIYLLFRTFLREDTGIYCDHITIHINKRRFIQGKIQI